ncbi:hypothetical protein EBR96_08075 [bacterium]|nr:hypothetical protein [bacterium]
MEHLVPAWWRPTGATRLKNQENQEAEVPVQPGSGSTDYRLTLQYRFAAATIRDLDGLFAELPMQLTARYTWNGVGTDSWKNGDELSAAVTTQWPLTRTAQVEAGILAKYQKTAQPGTTGESVSSTGGKSVIANLGYQTALTPNLNWSISGYLPLYQYVNGQQLGVDSIIQTGFEWML